MIFWACGGIAVLGGVLATFMTDLRRAVLALWVCGLGVGGLYLSLGAELLAVIQWLLSTLIAIAFIFYAVMFGEFSTPEDAALGVSVTPEPEKKKEWFRPVMPLIVGSAFAGMIWLGATHLPSMAQHGILFSDPHEIIETTKTYGPQTQETEKKSEVAMGVQGLGRSLAEDHLLAVEILALLLFLVIVGSGVVARLEKPET
ncbi:NADH-quinone oxidoreductase subunit J [bacterium]|nr:NADH-quinone oxidoreductase subunit J [bacterium]